MTYRRRCRDILMERRGYVPLKRLGDVPLKHRWVFHLRLVWDVVEAYRWDVVVTSLETSSRRSNKMLWRCTTERSWWRSTETSLGVSFKTYLQRRWDLLRDVLTTSCYRVGETFERLRKNQITSFDNLLLLYPYSYRKEFQEDLASIIKKMEDHLRQYSSHEEVLLK